VDLVLRRARLTGGEEPVDIGVQAGLIAAVAPRLEARGRLELDADGRLVTPSLVEPHVHLDAALTVGQPRYNQSGSLFEGIEIWAERVRSLTHEDVKRRAHQVLRWTLVHGVTHVRTHVDVCDPSLTALRALLEVKREVAPVIQLQIVAFPQQGIYSFPDGERLLQEAVRLGVDVVGGIPHYEWTREYGERDVKFALGLAAEHGLLADLHCDETDDDQSRFLEILCAETIRLGLQGRVTASHTTAMHSYNNAYAYRLLRWIRHAGVHFVTNPLDNAVLQGRFDSYPVRRGYTRIKELLANGINVAIGHDSVMDPWYPLGVGDPLQAAFVLVHYGHMSGYDEIRELLQMVTTRAGRCLGLDNHRIEPGAPANLVVFEAESEFDAVRTLAPRRWVLSGGQLVARTDPARSFVRLGSETEEEVTFRPDDHR